MQAVRAPTRDAAAGEGAPRRTFPLPGLDDLEHLVLRDRGNLWQRHAPLASFLLPLLLDGVAQHLQPSTRSEVPPLRWAPARVAPGSHLCSIDFATVEQIRRDRPLGLLGVVRRRGVLLAVRLQAAPARESAAACGRAGRAGRPAGRARTSSSSRPSPGSASC